MMKTAEKHFSAMHVVRILAIILVCILVALIVAFCFVYVYIRRPIRCDSVEKLSELVRIDLSDKEITDIKYQWTDGDYTELFVFLKESSELEATEYYINSKNGGSLDPEVEHIAPGGIKVLKEIGIELHQIQQHGWNYGTMDLGFGRGTTDYRIDWHQIDESYDGESNVVLLAFVPCRVSLKADKILKSE